ncbi:DUF1080 domain-containing protein [Ravibacter arvi]|uniref:DUF1080 domain-containing protein n=1 Tax=Ravibacter arvi TaxID=2051041 RepID=A0ABP8MB16_9BACT
MKWINAVFLAGLVTAGYAGGKKEGEKHNVLTKKEAKAGWVLLFDGKTTNGWHNYLKKGVSGWMVMNGELMTEGRSGDIVTDAEFGNFEITVDWKIKEKGNSGIFYYIVEDPANKRMYESGPEFQIIDNKNYPQKLEPNQVTGSASDVLPPSGDYTKPVGEWNSTRIIVKNGKAEHWLNGKKILSYDLESDAWKEAVKKSKFAPLNYTKTRSGRIGLQDHGNFVAYRNVKLRKLD